jgi:uncharacterized protein (DUF2384 family)
MTIQSFLEFVGQQNQIDPMAASAVAPNGKQQQAIAISKRINDARKKNPKLTPEQIAAAVPVMDKIFGTK